MIVNQIIKLILTNQILENHEEYIVIIVIYILKVLNLLLYVDLIVIVLHC